MYSVINLRMSGVNPQNQYQSPSTTMVGSLEGYFLNIQL